MVLLQSFRVRLALLFGLLIACGIALLSVLVGQWVAAAQLRDQGDALQSIARATSLVLSEGLHERLREIEQMALAFEARPHGLEPAVWRP